MTPKSFLRGGLRGLEWDSPPMLNTAAAATRSVARSVWGVFVPAVLPVAGYGAYSVLLTTAGVIAQAGLLGTSQTILREPGRKLPIGGLLLHSLGLAAVLIPVAVWVAPVRDPRYWWLLAGLTVAVVWYAIAVPRAKAAGAFAEVLRAEGVGAGAFALAIVFVIITTARGRREVDYGLVAVLETVASGAVLVTLGRSSRGRIGRKEWALEGTQALLPSVYSVGGLVLLDLLIWRRLEIYFLQGSPDGLQGVAVFGLASQLSTLLLLFPSAIIEAWSPALAAGYQNGWEDFERLFALNKRVYHRAFAVLLLLALCGSPFLVRVAFPKYWVWIWQILAFVMIRIVCSYAGFQSAAMYATKRERWLYMPVLMGGAVGVASNALLTLRWGLSGAIGAYALTQGTVALSTLIAFGRSKRRPSPPRV